MRTHLENAIVVSRDLGQSEDEAAQNALTQFGTAQDLGENIVWAWRRGQELNKKNLFGAAAVTLLILYVMTFLMNQNWYYGILNALLPRTFLLYCGKHQAYGLAFAQAIVLTNYALAGGLAGILFPKQGVRGACLGLVVFWIGWVAVMGLGRGGLSSFLTYWVFDSWTVTAIIAAWIGSRYQKARMSRVRLAQG